MLPIALVTGFLGSGKTTFLRQLSARHPGRRLAFVVNDFASVDVDAQALADLDGDVISLPGGSIFCRCLATSFTGTLRRIAALDPPPEGVVVEASGMADPRSVADLLVETRLDRDFRLATVIALADPATFRKLLVTLPAVRAQVETADLVLLNKTDMHDEETLRKTEDAVRGIRPDVAMVRCTRANVEVSLFEGASQAMTVHAPLAPCRDVSFRSASVNFDPAVPHDLADLLRTLESHAGMLWRAKGFVPTAKGMVEVQWCLGSPPAIRVLPPRQRIPAPALVLVARGDASDALDRLVTGLARSAPGTLSRQK